MLASRIVFPSGDHRLTGPGSWNNFPIPTLEITSLFDKHKCKQIEKKYLIKKEAHQKRITSN